MTAAKDNAALWSAYRVDRSSENRNKLVVAYLGVVELVARKFVKRLPAAGLDEIRSAGSVGLIRAVERFDASRGINFVTFAGHRVSGAILDYAREVDHLPRDVRRRLKEWETAADLLYATTGREPRPDEVEAQLGVEPGSLDDDMRTAGTGFLCSFESLVSDKDGRDLESPIADVREAAVGADIEDADECEHMLSLGVLDDRERLALRMHYQQDRPLKDVAPSFGHTAAWASLLLKNAREKLRAELVA